MIEYECRDSEMKKEVLPQTKLVSKQAGDGGCLSLARLLTHSLSISPTGFFSLARSVSLSPHNSVCGVRVCAHIYYTMSQFSSYLYRIQTWVKKLTHLMTQNFFYSTSSSTSSSFFSFFLLCCPYSISWSFCFNVIYNYDWPKGLDVFKMKI